MKEKNVKFKTRIIGGFDRRDVINYLKTVSEERRALCVELNALRERERTLSDELARAERLQLSEAELCSADGLLARLELQHAEIGAQIKRIRERFEAAARRDSTEHEGE